MHQFLPYAWFQGQCVPFEEARISIATHALHYGTGAFGGNRQTGKIDRQILAARQSGILPPSQKPQRLGVGGKDCGKLVEQFGGVDLGADVHQRSGHRPAPAQH